MPDDIRNPRLDIGGNNPPSPIEALRAELAENSGKLIARRDELLSGVERAPAEIADEEICGKVADLVKMIMACHKASEAARVAAKEPYLEAGRAVDGFYRAITDPLEKARKTLDQRLTAYQRRKAEEERRRREEEAARQRAEAEAARRAAEEAEAKARDERDLADAITAEEIARQAVADAAMAQRAAEAKPAELSRSRGDYGAVASLRTRWVGEIADRDALDLDALRPHLPIDGLERAVNAFVRAGGRELRGAKIYEVSTTAVR